MWVAAGALRYWTSVDPTPAAVRVAMDALYAVFAIYLAIWKRANTSRLCSPAVVTLRIHEKATMVITSWARIVIESYFFGERA